MPELEAHGFQASLRGHKDFLFFLYMSVFSKTTYEQIKCLCARVCVRISLALAKR